jgi:peptidoglycan/xylan/chitin deacetylase (PgdA/CDA1 family)
MIGPRRKLLASLLGGSVAVMSLLRQGPLRILAYHRVLDWDRDSFPFDEGVISATTEGFRQQMKFVRANFDVISFADLREFELRGSRWPRRPIIITFDDGYRDNYTNAFPVLKEFGLRATIFLTSGHIGSPKLFWWDQIAYCIKHSERAELSLPAFSREPVRISNLPERIALIERVLAWVKSVPEEIKERFLEELAREARVAPPSVPGMHMSWDEVREMAASGIEFGSHTVTHPILSNVSRERLREEILHSKRTIEREIGSQIIVFAYPSGARSRFNREAKQMAASCGFLYAVSYEEGVIPRGHFDRYEMPRIHVEAYQSIKLFRANLAFPYLMLRVAHEAISQIDR